MAVSVSRANLFRLVAVLLLLIGAVEVYACDTRRRLRHERNWSKQRLRSAVRRQLHVLLPPCSSGNSRDAGSGRVRVRWNSSSASRPHSIHGSAY